jgi:uncharacterized phiE125 gp8 family phage protein
MSYALSSGPTEEPVTLEALKAHLRVDISDDDDLIIALALAARQKVEQDTGRALCTQEWIMYLDEFPDSDSDPIRVGYPPLVTVDKIEYVDSAGTTTEWAAAKYDVDIVSTPGRILPAYGYSWPTTRDAMNAVSIEFTAGYGLAAEVPAQLLHAIKLLVGTWYEHRETIVTGTIATSLPDPIAYRALIFPYWVPAFV